MNNLYYFEIQATDPAALGDFYKAVLGWTLVKQGGLPIEYYNIEGAGIPGGLLKRPIPVPAGPAGTNAFTCSFQVADFDAIAKQILDHGGIVAMAKFAVPGKCWQGYFVDPDGNTFGLFQPDEAAA